MFNFIVLSATGVLFAISGFVDIKYQMLIIVTTLLLAIPLLHILDRKLKNQTQHPVEPEDNVE